MKNLQKEELPLTRSMKAQLVKDEKNKKIVKVQSLIRGYLAKKQFKKKNDMFANMFSK